MATIPTVSTTFAAGQRLRAIDVNETNAAVNFANTARVCCVYNGAAQTLSTGTPTTFLFPSETSDDYSFHSTSVNTGRITPTLEGWYVVTGSVSWAANATGARRIALAKSGGGTLAAVEGPGHATIAITQTVTAIVELNGTTDYITLSGYQTSGGNLDTSIADAHTSLALILLGS